jgi:hypothetical protein
VDGANGTPREKKLQYRIPLEKPETNDHLEAEAVGFFRAKKSSARLPSEWK